jgi:hypothetical protein
MLNEWEHLHLFKNPVISKRKMIQHVSKFVFIHQNQIGM